MKQLLSFVTLSFVSTLFFVPQITAEENKVKINEFAAVTAGKSPDLDWVELYSDTNNPISLEGWELRDSLDSSPKKLSGCIKSGGFRKFDFSNRLNNSGDKIRLFSDKGIMVDAIEYFSDQVPSHQKGASTGREPDGSGDWQVFSTPTPTNTSCTQQNGQKTTSSTNLKVSLSEIFPNPEKGGQEWVEIYNPNFSSVNLSNWSLVDAADHKKTLSGAVSAKSYKVFRYSSGWLNNGGDGVTLINAASNKIEKYTFGAADKGVSFAKDSNGKWHVTITPTPGKANKISTTNSGNLSSSANQTEMSVDLSTTTGLDQSVDFLSGGFQIDAPSAFSSQEEGAVAGINKESDKSSSIATLLIASGIALVGTAIAWPFLERMKII
ncbi:MAG: lamin tail domain-containing protein [Candidatus Woykebacteria bacterium]